MIKIKNEKGITLLTLVIAVIMMLILTAALATNTYSSLQLSNLTKLQNDIEILSDRVAAYYVKTGEVPSYRPTDNNYKASKSSVKSQFGDEAVANSDGDIYYTLNLDAIDVSKDSLSYGKEWSNASSDDRYIINEKTHIIYYVKGVYYEGTKYHTTGKNI